MLPIVALFEICIGKKWDENLIWGWNGESPLWSSALQQGLVSNLPPLHALLPRIPESIKGLKWEEANGNEVILFIALFLTILDEK